MRLIEKVRDGSKIKKKYDKPATPYERFMLAPNMSEKQKEQLRGRFKTLNPFELKQGLEKKLGTFFSLLRQSKTIVDKITQIY
jgi:hypothetical protein